MIPSSAPQVSETLASLGDTGKDDSPLLLSDTLQARHGRWLLKLFTACVLYFIGGDGGSRDLKVDGHRPREFIDLVVSLTSRMLQLRDQQSSEGGGGIAQGSIGLLRPLSADAMTRMLSSIWDTNVIATTRQEPHHDFKRRLHRVWLGGLDDGSPLLDQPTVPGTMDPLERVGLFACRDFIIPMLRTLLLNKVQPLPTQLLAVVVDSSSTIAANSQVTENNTLMRCDDDVEKQIVEDMYNHVVKLLRNATGLSSTDDLVGYVAADVLLAECQQRRKQQSSSGKGHTLKKKIKKNIGHGDEVAITATVPHQQPSLDDHAALLPMTRTATDFATTILELDMFCRLEEDHATASRLLRAVYLHKDEAVRGRVFASHRFLSAEEKRAIVLHDTQRRSRCQALRWFDFWQVPNSEAMTLLSKHHGRLCPTYRPFLMLVSSQYLASLGNGRGGCGIHYSESADEKSESEGVPERRCDSNYHDYVTSSSPASLHAALRSVNHLTPQSCITEVTSEAVQALLMTRQVFVVSRPHLGPVVSSGNGDDVQSMTSVDGLLSTSVLFVVVNGEGAAVSGDQASTAAVVGNDGWVLPLHGHHTLQPWALYSGATLRVEFTSPRHTTLRYTPQGKGDPLLVAALAAGGGGAIREENAGATPMANSNTKTNPGPREAPLRPLSFDLVHVKTCIQSAWIEMMKKRSELRVLPIDDARVIDALVIDLPKRSCTCCYRRHHNHAPDGASIETVGMSPASSSSSCGDDECSGGLPFHGRTAALRELRQWLTSRDLEDGKDDSDVVRMVVDISRFDDCVAECVRSWLLVHHTHMSNQQHSDPPSPASSPLTHVQYIFAGPMIVRASSHAQAASAGNAQKEGQIPKMYVSSSFCSSSDRWVVLTFPSVSKMVRRAFVDPWHGGTLSGTDHSRSTVDEQRLLLLQQRLMEAVDSTCNDRLEFFGDAVLDYCLVHGWLFCGWRGDGGGGREDRSTVLEAAVAEVATQATTRTSAAVGTATQLGQFMLSFSSNAHLGAQIRSPLKEYLLVVHHVAPKAKTFADCFEAVIGAHFLHAVQDLKWPWSQAVDRLQGFLQHTHFFDQNYNAHVS